MKYLIVTLFVLAGVTAKAQLPSSTFPSRIFNGNTKASWILLDSPVVNPVLDTFYARYAGTQIVRIQGGDTAFWFYGGDRRWFRSLLDRDTASLSNRINLKLNITDTTNKWWGIGKRWVDTVYRVNDSTIGFTVNGSAYTFEIKGGSQGGGGTGTVTSVGLSMPSAFSVTPSTITTNGTFSVSGAGTTAQYIRGNGTLATTDTGMIPNFHLKVRSLLSGTSPITYNSTTGAIGIPNANASGTKGAATFSGSSFTDNGSGLISLTNTVTGGSCTNCDFTVGADGRITAYSNGAAPGITSLNGLTASSQNFAVGTGGTDFNISSSGSTHTFNFPSASAFNRGLLTASDWTVFNNKLSNITGLIEAGTNITIDGNGIAGDPYIINSNGGGGGGINNANIGAGFRWLNGVTQELRTVANSPTITWDSTSTANTLTAKVDTSIIATQDDLLQLVVTADNGLTKTGNNFQLGGTLLQNTTISTTSSYFLNVTGANTSQSLKGTNTTTGAGVMGQSTNGSGIYGVSGSLNGVLGVSTSGTGLVGESTSGEALNAYVLPSSTNTLVSVGRIQRFSSGTAANGIGGSFDWYTQSTSGSAQRSNRIGSIWTDATTATRTSMLEFYGVNNASEARKAALSGAGQWIWDGYPLLTAQVDTTTYKPVAIDGSGNVVKMAGWAGSGGGGGSGTVTQVNTGYGLSGGPITTTGTVIVDTPTVDNRYFNGVRVTRFGAVGDSVTDNTAAIQAAINYTWEQGGGTVIFPAGYYTVSGPIMDSVNGRECRCQLYLPYSSSDSARVIKFVAENNVDFEVIGIDGMPVSKKGVIIASSLTGTEDTTFILGALKGPGSGTFTKTNHTTPWIEGIGFRTRLDAGANGIGGLNFRYASKIILNQVKIDINTPIFNMPDISGIGSIGLLVPERGNHAQTEIGALRIVGYHTGMDIQEHLVAQDIQLVACYIGAYIDGGDHSSSIQTLEAELNKYNVFVEGQQQVFIANFNSEHYTTSDKWFEFVMDVYVNNVTDYGRLTLGNYSASNSGTGTYQFAPTTNHAEVVNVLGSKFQSNLPGNFMSAMLGEFSTSPGRAILQLNDITAVTDVKRSLLYNASGSISWAFASDDGLTQNRFFNVENAGLSTPPVVNWVVSSLKVGSSLSLGASTAKLEVTTPDAVGIRVNMSNTGVGTTAILFNRASTSVENAFNWATNGTNKWFVGQDNDGTDDFVVYSWTANKFVLKINDASGDIGFGNSQTDLYVKNGSAVLVNTNADNGVGKLQLNGKITVATHDIASNSDSALIWDRSTNEYKVALINGGGGATTLYNGDGTLGGHRIVTGSNNNLTFTGVNAFRINSNTVVLSNFSGTIPYTGAVVGAANQYWYGFTPSAGVYSKGTAMVVDTNNNIGFGVAPPTTMPRYATGNNTYIDNLQVEGGQFGSVTNINTSTTLSLESNYIRLDATSGNITITLPAANTAFGSPVGIHYIFKRIDNSGNSITIQRAGSDTIDGGTSITLTAQYEVKELQCSSTSTWDVR